MNQHLSDLKLITTLHGRFTEGRLLALGIAKTAIRTAVTSRLLGEASGVLTTIPAFRRTERLRTAGLTEAVDQAAMDKANYVRRIVDGKPVLLRVVNRQNGKLMVPDPANPNRNMEVDPNDVAPVSDEDAKKEQEAEKAGGPAPGQAPVTEAHQHLQWVDAGFGPGSYKATYKGYWLVAMVDGVWNVRKRSDGTGSLVAADRATSQYVPGDEAAALQAAKQAAIACVDGLASEAVTEAHGVATMEQYKAALSDHVRDCKDRLEFRTNWLSDIADAQNVGQLNIIAQKCGVDHEFRDAKRRLNRQLCTEGGMAMWSARNEHPEHAYSEWQTEHHSSHGRCPKYHDWVEGKLEGAQHRPNCQFFAGAACSCGGQQPVEESVRRPLADRILSENVSPEMAARPRRIKYARKPHRWGDIPQVRIPRHELVGLRTVSADDLLEDEGGDDAPTSAHFSEPMEQHFVLERKGRLYLVDTGGYDYARYIVELSSIGADPMPEQVSDEVGPHSIGNPQCPALHGGYCPIPGHNEESEY